jgi:hypothetical protein
MRHWRKGRCPIFVIRSYSKRQRPGAMSAPVASSWSGCRVGFAPTGKRRLFTAHAKNRHPAVVSWGGRPASVPATSRGTKICPRDLCHAAASAEQSQGNGRQSTRGRAVAAPTLENQVTVVRQRDSEQFRTTPRTCRAEDAMLAGWQYALPEGWRSLVGRAFDDLTSQLDTADRVHDLLGFRDQETLALSQCATPRAARQCRRPDAEICGEEVS